MPIRVGLYIQPILIQLLNEKYDSYSCVSLSDRPLDDPPPKKSPGENSSSIEAR